MKEMNEKMDRLIEIVGDEHKVYLDTLCQILIGITRSVKGFENAEHPVMGAVMAAELADYHREVNKAVACEECTDHYFAAIDNIRDEMADDGFETVLCQIECPDNPDDPPSTVYATLYADGSVSLTGTKVYPGMAWEGIDEALADLDTDDWRNQYAAVKSMKGHQA